jgi:hemolysin activation/secretion protein
MRVVCIAAGCVGLLTIFGTLPSFAAEVSNPFIQQEAARVICTPFTGQPVKGVFS